MQDDTFGIAQVVFRHDPTSAPQWTYYGVNAPMAGSAQKLSEAKFAATRDLQFLSGTEKPAMRSYAEWAVEQETNPEGMTNGAASAPVLYVRSLQDEDTNQRLHRQNLAQAYLEGIRATPDILTGLPSLVPGVEVIVLVTLFPDDLLGDALLNLTEQDTVIFCLPDGDSLGFLPVDGSEVWPAEGGPGLLERFGLDEFATVRDLMNADAAAGDDGEDDEDNAGADDD
ncbi:MAG TPA: hypothetical protein H9751_01485 [Candidatus Corynebacterium faecigallinarum]|uniref:Uncharacterized protein n=1 Tax=Candidatus Corynebacterium faecigallinarum TaxID=2838528 RepID=A0A9D2TPE2_9CORY|nr:hypothetical protein [Candidatus Corynebacterium faecigallinarum]